MKNKRLKATTRNILATVLGIAMVANTFALGFSSWIYAETQLKNIDGPNYDVGQLNEIKALTVDENKPTTKFRVIDEGIDDDGLIVKECGVTFNFKLQNSLINQEISAITYKSSLAITNLGSSIEPYFKNMSVNGTVYTKKSPFPTLTARKQIYEQDFDLNLNRGVSDGFTKLSITYTFQGNFYNIMMNNLVLDLNVYEVARK